MNKKRTLNFKNQRLTVFLCGMLLILLVTGFITGCSAGSGKNNHYVSMPQTASSAGGGIAMDEASYDYGMMEAPEAEIAYDAADMNVKNEEAGFPASAPMPIADEDAVANTSDIKPEKIIQTANIDMQTDRFDEVVDRLRGIAPEHNGYVENANMYSHYTNANNVSLRTFTITLRVPTEAFENVRKYVESLAVVTNASQSAEDVTAQYYDIASRLETKQIEEERVLDMITRATKIEDLLALEERLGLIRTQIERYQSQINNIDRKAAYSTIYVYLNEVLKEDLIIVSDHLGARVQKAFLSSVNNTMVFFQNVLIFLAGAFIPMTVIGVLALVGIRIALAVIRKNKSGA